MDFSQINYIAVVAATISTFVLGGLWYGPIMGKMWMKGAGITEEDIQNSQGHMKQIYGTAFVLHFILAIILSALLPGDANWLTGMIWGIVLGAGLASTSLGVNYLFEGKSLKLFLVNSGYITIGYGVMGAIIGAF